MAMQIKLPVVVNIKFSARTTEAKTRGHILGLLLLPILPFVLVVCTCVLFSDNLSRNIAVYEKKSVISFKFLPGLKMSLAKRSRRICAL